MTSPKKSLQLLAAFVGILLAFGIRAKLPLAGKLVRCRPFVRFTDLKGFAAIRFANACLVKRMRDTAGAVTAPGEGRSLGLGVKCIVNIALSDEPLDQLVDRGRSIILPFPFPDFPVEIVGQFFPARCISLNIAYSQPMQALLI